MNTSTVCTCNADEILPTWCEIHGEKSRTVEMNKRRVDPSGYKLVCLCDCNCIHCNYTPLAKMLEKGTRISVYYFNEKGEKKKLSLVEDPQG